MLIEEDIIIDGITYTALEVAQAAELYPYTWVLQHEIKNESGLTMSFEKRKYLKAIYNDLSPKQVLLKPPQIGATIMSMLKTLWVAKMLRKDIIYTLPTATDVNDIVGGSTNRIIAQNAILKSWVKDHDTVEQKSVGDNLIRYRGTFSPKQATMVPSSLNVHDEVDNSDPAVLTLYGTRLEAQEKEEDKWQWYFSHPSLAGQGVDIYWQQSDMKEWYITCNACTKEQTLTWPESISMEKSAYICKHCKELLSDQNRIDGRWLNKDGIEWDNEQGVIGPYKFSGWHVSQLMLYNKKAEDIIAAYYDPLKDQQYFWNYVLGYPFIGSEDRVEPEVVLRNCVDVVNPRTERIVFGIDTGTGLHLVAMNKDGVFYYAHETELTATKSPYDEIRKLLKRFPNSIAVFDQGGELMLTRQLQQEFPGRVFLCFYNKDKKTIDFVEWGEGDEYWKVRVDRNRMITLAVEQIRDTGRVRLNGTREEWQDFADMFGNIYREKIVVKEMKGKDDRSLYGTEYVWKRSGADHYVHAFVYALIGMQRYGGEAAKIGGDGALAGVKTGQIVTPDNGDIVVGGVGAGDFAQGNRVF